MRNRISVDQWEVRLKQVGWFLLHSFHRVPLLHRPAPLLHRAAPLCRQAEQARTNTYSTDQQPINMKMKQDLCRNIVYEFGTLVEILKFNYNVFRAYHNLILIFYSCKCFIFTAKICLIFKAWNCSGCARFPTWHSRSHLWQPKPGARSHSDTLDGRHFTVMLGTSVIWTVMQRHRSSPRQYRLRDQPIS